MICCDTCLDWFHGKCVGITKQKGKEMEEAGQEWKCQKCVEGVSKASDEGEEANVEDLLEDDQVEEIEETIITVGGDNKITVETITGEQKEEEEEDRENEGYDVRYMCSQCDQVFMTMSLLESHQTTQHSTLPGTTFQCNFCGEKFPTRHDHERHTVEQHNQFIINQVGQESG